MGMAQALEEYPNFKTERRYTDWYVWKCPRPRCRKKIEATVERWVAVLAKRHLQGHATQDKKGIATDRLLQEVGRAQ